MTLPTAIQGSNEARPRMPVMGPGRPGNIEKAHNPRRAVVRLFFYLEPYKWTLVIVLVLVFIYTILGLIAPFLLGVAIDKFMGARNASGLIRITLLMLLAYVLNNLFQAIANWVMAGLSQRALKQMRR